jgi:hypothetical protein
MVRGLWVPRVLPAVLAGIVLLSTVLAAGSVSVNAASGPSGIRALSNGPSLAGNPPPAVQPSAAPTLSVTGLVPTDASLGWTPAASFGFDNYTVFQSTNGSNGPWQSIGFIAKASTSSFVAGSLTPGSIYWWYIQTVTSNILGAQTTQSSNVVSASPPGLSYLNVTLTNPTTAQLTWTNNATYGGGFAFDWYTLYEIAGTGAPGIVANISTQTTHQASISPLSAGAAYAFYVDTSDCVAGCGTATPTTVVSESNPVTIGTPETLVASINSERSVVDVGQPDLFTCTPSGGKSPYAISWNDGNGTFVAGPGTQSLSFNASGTPIVQCKIKDADATNSEAGTSVAVNPAPTLIATTNRTTADVGGPISFSCVPSGGTSPTTVTWVFGDGGEIGLGLTTHAYALPARVVASCAVTDFTGTEVGSSVGITISPLPDLGLTVSSSYAAPGTVLTFHGHPSNGSGNASALAWTFGDGSVASGTNSTHAFSTAGHFDVRVRTVDSNGVPAFANDTVVVSPISVAVTAATATVHTGASLRFNATASGGAGGPYNFSWTFGDGGRAYGPIVLHAFSRAGEYAPVLHVTDHLGAVAAKNLTAISAITPPAPPVSTLPSWWILIAGAVALAVGTFLALSLYRRAEADSYGGSFRWVPFTDPNRTLKGVRVCRNCGTPNNAAREGCQACGAPIAPSFFG